MNCAALLGIAGMLIMGLTALYLNAVLSRARVVGLYKTLLLERRPTPGDTWIQDGQRLFVVHVLTGGVSWSWRHPLASNYKPQESLHHDSWDDWRRRLKQREVLFTSKQWSQDSEEEANRVS